MLLIQRSFRALLVIPSTSGIARHASNKPSVLDKMAELASRLKALETPDGVDPSSSGPKPNALKDHPEEEPIPPLPAPVKGWPTPWITEHDVLSYVYPLYTRGWGHSLKLWRPPPPKVKSLTKTTEPEKATEKDMRERYTMLFSARYRFQDYDSAVEFFLKLVDIAKAEKHHPSVLIANGNPFTVTVTTQTDSAKRPIWVEEQQRPTDSSLPLSPLAPIKIPGLTLRDIRLAILTETMYSADFASHHSSLGRRIHPANFRLSWSAMERIWKRQVLLPKRETGRTNVAR